MKQVASDAKDNWIQAGKNIGIDGDYFRGLEALRPNIYHNELLTETGRATIEADGVMTDAFKNMSGLTNLENELKNRYDQASEIQHLEFFLEFQKVYVSAWKSTNLDFINPLIHRIKTSFRSLEKVVDIKDNISNDYKEINIFNLVNANLEVKRLIPMLISKMFYDLQKSIASRENVPQTKHLIIDEAHNILNADSKNVGDAWQDYRLSIFEEIIKEGRKFGFFFNYQFSKACRYFSNNFIPNS